MKNLKLITLTLAVIMVFITCKKEATPINPQNSSTTNGSVDNTIALIKKFKQTLKNNNTTNEQARTFASGLKPDSATYYLEAGLNFDFDKGKDIPLVPQGTQLDSVVYPNLVPTTTNGFISASALSDAYNYFAHYCDSITNPTVTTNKIKIIDIISTSNLNGTPPGLYYKAYINSIVLTQRPTNFTPACMPFTVESAMWSSFYTQACMPPSLNDGPTLCENRLNCQISGGFGCGAGGQIFYTNVTTAFFMNNPNTYLSALYYKNPAAYCNNTILTPAILNGFVTGSQSLGASNLPTWGGPAPTIIITNYDMTDVFSYTGPTNWWNINITYGRAFCNTAVGNP